MSQWWWVVIAGFGVVTLLALLVLAAVGWAVLRYLDYMTRIFQEKPLFIIPRGRPVDGAEDVSVPTPDGLNLRGCYLRGVGPRKGVILFGLEYGSNCWACFPYCEHLLAAGYDVFACEPRNQGESEHDPLYDPLQWVTDRDLIDLKAALNYLHSRPDADPNGIGLFGISKGGSVGVVAAMNDPRVKCFVADGIYGMLTTVVPYMRRWVTIYSHHRRAQDLLPSWFYRQVGKIGISRVARLRKVKYLSVETAAEKFHRPVLMIHGGGDTYIKPEMAESLFGRFRGEKELWVVAKAKHNQALHAAGAEYHRQVVAFFDRHLGGKPLPTAPVATGDTAEANPLALAATAR